VPDLCPPLHGELVILHPLRVTHADILFPVLNDPELWQFTESTPPESVEELRRRYLRLESRMSPDREQHWLNWAIEERTTSRIGGIVQATVQSSRAAADIAYVVGRAFWGKGLASSSVRAMLAFLGSAGVTTFRATVDSKNLRSIRLLERLGFQAMDTTDPRNFVFTRETQVG
jgi:ribosomal-protein-alanine N-acetyltransferase